MYSILPSKQKQLNDNKMREKTRILQSRAKDINNKIDSLKYEKNYKRSSVGIFRIFTGIYDEWGADGVIAEVFLFPLFALATVFDNIFVAPFCRMYNKNKRKKLDSEIKQLELEIEKYRIEECEFFEMLEGENESYRIGFEKEAERLSANYENSPITKEISSWLAGDFIMELERTDRSSNVENVTATLEFDVKSYTIEREPLRHIYKDYRSAEPRSYDFDKHRCAELPDVLSKAALARAIASQIKETVIDSYKKDSSGTSYELDVKYKYVSIVTDKYQFVRDPEYVTVYLTYNAKNGSFKPIESWYGANSGSTANRSASE